VPATPWLGLVHAFIPLYRYALMLPSAIIAWQHIATEIDGVFRQRHHLFRSGPASKIVSPLAKRMAKSRCRLKNCQPPEPPSSSDYASQVTSKPEVQAVILLLVCYPFDLITESDGEVVSGGRPTTGLLSLLSVDIMGQIRPSPGPVCIALLDARVFHHFLKRDIIQK
jgi:hypothetical protein